MASDRNYLVGLSKLRYYPQLQTIGGYINPSEFKALLDKGFISTQEWHHPYIFADLKAGKSNSRWLYFEATKDSICKVKSGNV